MTASEESDADELLERWRRENRADLDATEAADRDRLIKLGALAQLISSGLDPAKPRRFRASVLVTIRCRPQATPFTNKPTTSRRLALVYDTPYAPVLIPDLAAPTLRLPYPGAWRNATYQRAKLDAEREQLLSGTPVRRRKEWLCVRDTEDGPRATVPGLRVVTAATGQPLERGGLIHPDWIELHCPVHDAHWLPGINLRTALAGEPRPDGTRPDLFAE